MLELISKNKGLYELVETQLTFTKTYKRSWFYDFERMLVSQQDDFPESLATRAIIDTVKKSFETVYLPNCLSVNSSDRQKKAAKLLIKQLRLGRFYREHHQASETETLGFSPCDFAIYRLLYELLCQYRNAHSV